MVDPSPKTGGSNEDYQEDKTGDLASEDVQTNSNNEASSSENFIEQELEDGSEEKEDVEEESKSNEEENEEEYDEDYENNDNDEEEDEDDDEIEVEIEADKDDLRETRLILKNAEPLPDVEDQTTKRHSGRQRKPTKPFDFEKFEKVKQEEEDYMEDLCDYGDTSRETSEDPQGPSTSSSSRRGNSRVRNPFSKEERCHVFQFILEECRSKVPGREGRIAKMKVQTTLSKTWDKFQKVYGYKRKSSIYRIHYNFYSKKLHTVPGLTLEERADLYYAMEMPVTDKKERENLIQEFGAIITADNIVVGSTKLTHWDFTHSGSDEEKVDSTRDRFVEYHDGVMWQFIVDRINEGNDPISWGTKLWKSFRETNNAALIVKKSVASYLDRCRRVIVPNLHIMPFDIEAKAALYQSLDYPVPIEFRFQLIAETGVELDESGLITDYPNRPPHIILQSRDYDSPIGLTSTTAYSTLREPEHRIVVSHDDRNPWTPEEDRKIWEYVRRRATDNNGRLHKLSQEKLADPKFWFLFLEEMPTERACRSLAARFKKICENAITTTDFDVKTILEIYYMISKKVDEQAAGLFQAIAILVVDDNETIRFAVGFDFLLGRIDGEDIYEDTYAFYYHKPSFNHILGIVHEEPSTSDSFTETRRIAHTVMMHINRFEIEEREAFKIMSNSNKFPYVESGRVKSSLNNVHYRKRKMVTDTKEMEGLNEDFKLVNRVEDGEDRFLMDKVPKVEEVEEEFQWGQVEQEGGEQPNLYDPNAMTEVEAAIANVRFHIAEFHQKLKMCSENMSDQKRAECLEEIEQLTRMFRLSGKQVLIDPETRKKKPKKVQVTA